jgi:hypothetical protein
MPQSTLTLSPASGDASRVRRRPSTLGADIFLADAAGRYLGRICHYREC